MSRRGALTALLVVSLGVATACGPHIAAASPSRSPSPAPDYVPWLPLAVSGNFPQAAPATPAPPVPIPAGTPLCRASGLQGILYTTMAATGAQEASVILIRNAGSSQCYLDGYPNVTVLDAHGKVLAHAEGSSNEGTYFPDWPEVQVLLEPVTPKLIPGPVDLQSLRGQADINVQWYDCSLPHAAELLLDLPNAGGTLTVAYAFQPPHYGGCDGGNPGIVLTRGPLSPAGYIWQPDQSYLSVDFAISAPASVKAGSTLEFFVTVTNSDQSDYVLDPCPDYTVILGSKVAVSAYQLNCGPVGRIAPGASVKFQIKLAVPSQVPPRQYSLTWSLGDGRVAMPQASTSIEVT